MEALSKTILVSLFLLLFPSHQGIAVLSVTSACQSACPRCYDLIASLNRASSIILSPSIHGHQYSCLDHPLSYSQCDPNRADSLIALANSFNEADCLTSPCKDMHCFGYWPKFVDDLRETIAWAKQGLLDCCKNVKPPSSSLRSQVKKSTGGKKK